MKRKKNTQPGFGLLSSVQDDPGSQQPWPFRRVTFSVVSQPQDPHQGSLQSCYDSGLDESETPSSKSSTGPRLGALPLPEDAYERTTPDGSVGWGCLGKYVRIKVRARPGRLSNEETLLRIVRCSKPRSRTRTATNSLAQKLPSVWDSLRPLEFQI
ncbi:hypothetical protein SRHO_G00025850 [Serrasalmus rhombeus]